MFLRLNDGAIVSATLGLRPFGAFFLPHTLLPTRVGRERRVWVSVIAMPERNEEVGSSQRK